MKEFTLTFSVTRQAEGRSDQIHSVVLDPDDEKLTEKLAETFTQTERDTLLSLAVRTLEHVKAARLLDFMGRLQAEQHKRMEEIFPGYADIMRSYMKPPKSTGGFMPDWNMPG